MSKAKVCIIVFAVVFIGAAATHDDPVSEPAPSGRTSVYDNDYETVEQYAERNEISFEVAECEFRLDDYYTSRGEIYDPEELGRACGNPHDLP